MKILKTLFHCFEIYAKKSHPPFQWQLRKCVATYTFICCHLIFEKQFASKIGYWQIGLDCLLVIPKDLQ